MARYSLSHVTDSVVGRQGFTLDWPETLRGANPDDWGRFTGSPPLD